MQLKTLVAAALATTASAQVTNLTATLASQPDLANLTTFITLIPNLVQQLSGATNVTLLAPSNEAFAKFLASAATSGITTNDTDIIEAILTYHVLDGVFQTSNFTATPTFIPTQLTSTEFVNVTGGQVVEAVQAGNSTIFFSGLLQNSTVTTPNINFTGGVIHIVDTLLTVPQNITATAGALNLTSVLEAVVSEGFTGPIDVTPDYTVFVPNNAAFDAISSLNLSLAQIATVLEYHVINGTVAYSSDLVNGMQIQAVNKENVTITLDNGTIFVNSARVVIPNVLVANGVVHVIDNVLNPNATTLTPNPTATSDAPAFTGASGAPSGSGSAGGSGTATTTTGNPSGTTGPSSSSSAAGAWAPARTGAVGLGALFAVGAGAVGVVGF